MLQEIRDGNLSLRAEVLQDKQCKVWTSKEVEALNFYLTHKEEVHQLLGLGNQHSYANPEYRLAPFGLREIYISPLWLHRIEGFTLTAALTAKGEVKHWLSVQGEPHHLAFCLEEWESWDHS